MDEAQMADQQSRTAFEKWLATKPELNYGNHPPQRYEDGYSYGPSEIAWRGWQAARRDAFREAIGVAHIWLCDSGMIKDLEERVGLDSCAAGRGKENAEIS